jgi:Zn finger protein HypA/HybF involved in hydrogenase expression
MNSILNNKELLELVVKRNTTKKEILKEFGLQPYGKNYKTLDYYINLFQINSSHFLTRKQIFEKTKVALSRIIQFEDIFCNPTKSKLNNQEKKKRLLKLGLKEDRCEECGISNIWNNKPIILQLDHIDGDNQNNEVSNLKVICPNCHTQTKTFSGRNIKGYSNKKEKKVKKLDKEIKDNLMLEQIKEQLIESNIDFSKKTWGVEVSKLLNKSPQYCLKFVKENFKDLLK